MTSDASDRTDRAGRVNRSDRADPTDRSNSADRSVHGDSSKATVEESTESTVGGSTEAAVGGSIEAAADGSSTGSRASTAELASPDEPHVLRAFDTERWVGIAGITLLLVGLGIVLRQASLVLAGGVGLGYVAYAKHGDAPAAALEVERTLEDPSPGPGEEVQVRVTVRNAGESSLPDLRLVDGVPPALEVVGDPARLATALRPGASATFSYAVRATRGVHEWTPLRAVTRSPAGSRERETRYELATELRCAPELGTGSELPLRGLTTQYTGRVPTDVGGSGVEFYATREYRRGDPLKRVDWNRRARTGELATLELREERAATVALLIDAREDAYLAPEPEAENAVERSVDAASQLFTALTRGGDRVGIAALSADDCWLAPGAGSDHALRARELLATHPSLAPLPGEGLFYPSLWFRRLRRRLPSDAQVMLFSPLTDAYPATVARRLDAHGHLVTVVSPDVSATGTIGERTARLERANRIRTLRGAGIRVIDWSDESLATEVANARRVWR